MVVEKKVVEVCGKFISRNVRRKNDKESNKDRNSNVERIVEAVRKLRKSNPDETLEITVRVGLGS